MKLPLHEYIVALVEAVALTLLICRLAYSGLIARYKWFFTYVVLDLCETLTPFLIRSSQWYGNVFFAIQCLKLLTYVLIVFELYSILLRDLRGLAIVAKRYSSVALLVAVLLSALVVSALPHQSNPLRQLFYIEIPIISSLVLFILLIAGFIAYYPVPLHKNALVYAIGYVVFFICKVTGLFILNLHLDTSLRVFSTAFMVSSLACIIFWTIFLSGAGESGQVAVGSRWSGPAKQEQVLLRLREINTTLLRARPK